MSNENNNQFNNEARENHDGQFGHGQKRPYNRPKNYKYKPQHRNSYGRKPMQDRKAPADKEKNGIQVPFKAAIKNSSRRPKKPTSKLKIIPLGGLEQIGMNITAFEYEDSIVVVDCGLAFPEDDMLGIDLVIPDVTYLKENISKVKGFVITHGHEDHIGALPYVLKDVNVPVYSTKLTIALIANKLKEHNMTNTTKLKEVRHGQVINLGDFSIEFIKTNHSIQDASALAIYSPAGIVVHTGDFKVDYTPVFGDAIDLQRFAEIGRKGVLALMCDSTNAERTGFTMSERSVGHVFDNLFNEYKTNRIIIATFASNVDRVQQIINTAYRFGRKVAVEGRSMVNVITTAAELGYLRIPDQTLIEIDQVKNYPDEQVVLITTGSQGESMAALSRMAANIHKKIVIKPNDTIIFSSNPIPGNEKAVSHVINELFQKGADVIFQDVRIPATNLIGEENKGFAISQKLLARTRPTGMASALGVAQRALDLAVDYAQQRVTFGKPIASRQAIKFKLADMEIRLQTARAQLFYNAQLIDKGIYDGMLGSVTKTCVSEMVFDVANQALQIFGGYGYSREYPVEKLLRDARIFSLFEGTNEIQRMIIGGTLVPKKRN